MRQIAYNEIIKNKYSVYDKLDKFQRKNAAKKFCIDKYIELKNEMVGQYLWEEVPKKKYEIYKLIADGEKIFMIDTDFFPEAGEKEVYYDKEIAMKIYENMINLQDNVLNSFPDLMDFYQKEIEDIQAKIEKLKIEDENKYNEDLKYFKIIYDSNIFKSLKQELEISKKENLKLRFKVEKANNIIKSLSKKLEISLERVQELQNIKFALVEKKRKKLKKKY